MKLTLEAVFFDHDPASATRDAVSIRRNDLVPVCPPEWVRGLTPDYFGASVAAYARDAVAGNVITIKAALRCDEGWDTGSIDFTAPTVRIRTVEAQPATGCGDALARVFFPNSAPSSSPEPSVLGTVAVTEVTVGMLGATTVAELPLVGTRIASVGVGAHDVHWVWQWQRLGDSTWTDFAVTKHRIYTTLALPTAPWGQPSDGDATRARPWSEALEVACDWARGAQTIDAAADAITRRLYGVGSGILHYDCDGAMAHYAFADFHLTAMLERLHGGTGNGPRVNCVDCANAVLTFTNLLGGDLGEQRFDWGNSYALSLIGSNGSWTPCVGFGWHAVAWQGTNARTDRLWDACCELDMDADPGTPPLTGGSPVGIAHSRPWVGSYVWRVTMPDANPNYPNDFTPHATPPTRPVVY